MFASDYFFPSLCKISILKNENVERFGRCGPQERRLHSVWISRNNIEQFIHIFVGCFRSEILLYQMDFGNVVFMVCSKSC